MIKTLFKMKQLDILKKLVKETIDEMAGETAGAPSFGFYLTPDYKNQLDSIKSNPELAPLIYLKNGRLSSRVENVIGALEMLNAIGGDITTNEEGDIEGGIASLQQIATKAFGAGVEQQAVYMVIKNLLAAGIVGKSDKKYYRNPITDKLKSFEKSEKAPSTGLRGRPITTDKDLKMLGAQITLKFAKGNSDYTPEEVAYIKNLYKSLKK
jgi:hypothetical protein